MPGESQDNPSEGEDAVSLSDVIILTLITAVILYFVWRKFLRKENRTTHTLSLNIPKVGNGPIVSRSFYERAKTGGQRVVVFYGSQTGTAEAFASRLAKECKALGLGAFIYDPEDCDDWEELTKFRDLSSSLGQLMIIFCMATYGVGDPTDNAIEFMDWLKSTAVELNGLSYTVFGLGNKTYEHYNEIGEQ